MNFLARASLVFGLVVIGCGSSSSKTTTHHMVMTNETSVELVIFYGPSTDDSVDWATFQAKGGVIGQLIDAGQTQSYTLPAPGHYRWTYELVAPDPANPQQPTHTPINESTFDIVDANSDVDLTPSSVSSGDDDSGTPIGSCTLTGHACTREHDTCCNGDCTEPNLVCN